MDDCTDTQFYNYASGTCEPCQAEFEPNAEKTGCICKKSAGYTRKSIYDQSPDLEQLQKDVDMIGFSSEDVCRDCEDEDCWCQQPNQAILRYKLDGEYVTGNLTCQECDPHSYPSPQQDRCIPCTDPLMTFRDNGEGIYQCLCPTEAQPDGNTYKTAGDMCIRVTDLQGFNPVGDPFFKPYKFEDNGKLITLEGNSAYYEFYLEKSYVGCKTYEDPKSCNILANICIMNMYYLAEEQVCDKLAEGERPGKSKTTFNPNYHPSPWLFYQENIQEKIEKDTRFQGKVVLEEDLKSNNEVYFLEYYIMVFDLEGNLEDFRVLGTEFMLCPSSVLDGKSQRKFGTDFKNNCEVNLSNHLKNYKMKFFELYLKDIDGSFKEVPILIKNFVESDGQTPNKENGNNKRYVRRFFIVDNISARVGTFENTSGLQAIRYASDIKFQINLQDKEDEKIYMPIVTIEYKNMEVKGDLTNPTVEKQAKITYEVEYYYDPVDFWTNANVIFGIFCAGSFFLWCAKGYIYNKQNPNFNPNDQNLYFIINTVCIGLDIFADAMFYMLLILTGYWFVFFKIQQRSFVLLPSQSGSGQSENYVYFDTLFWIVFSFKAVGMIYLVIKQSAFDIFFIDWEKPKEKLYQPEDKDPGISVWRNLFVANEFNELQVVRTVGIEWTLFFLGFFMTGLRLENLAAETPDFTLDDDEVDKIQKNYVLKYFLASFIFLMIGLFQIVFKKIKSIKYALEIQDFNDLCTVGNISIIVFDSVLHGYYLHGKAPIGVSEGNSQWLSLALHKEAKAGATRGLIKGTDLQCFEFLVSSDFKKQYNAIYKNRLDDAQYQYNQRAQMGNQNQGIVNIQKATPQYDEQQYSLLEADKLNLQYFLMENLADIEQNSANHIMDKNIYTRLLGWPAIRPEDINQLPYFFKDPEYSIQKTMYLGQEINILIFDILTYCMWDIVFESTFVAISLTYVLDKFFQFWRAWLGRRNIAKKSLIDEMFLN